jgi:hypothetical protein
LIFIGNPGYSFNERDMRQTFFSDIAMGFAAVAGAKHPRTSTKKRFQSNLKILKFHYYRQYNRADQLCPGKLSEPESRSSA